MTALRQAILLLLCALLPALASTFLHPQRPAFTEPAREGEITISEALRDPAAYLWIDARAASEFQKEHIPGALPLNEDAWDDLLPAVLQGWPTGKPALVYCDSQQCEASDDVAKRLREFGVAPVLVLKGGWKAWLQAQPK